MNKNPMHDKSLPDEVWISGDYFAVVDKFSNKIIKFRIRQCYHHYTHSPVKRSHSIQRKYRYLTKRGYTRNFNNHFKQEIRRRDHCICAICEKPGRNVHHIDYDKENTIWANCISLCRKCHRKTNNNRTYWHKQLVKIMELRVP